MISTVSTLNWSIVCVHLPDWNKQLSASINGELMPIRESNLSQCIIKPKPHNAASVLCTFLMKLFAYFPNYFFYSNALQLILYLTNYVVSLFFSHANSTIHLEIDGNSSAFFSVLLTMNVICDVWRFLNILQLLCIQYMFSVLLIWRDAHVLVADKIWVCSFSCFHCRGFQH